MKTQDEMTDELKPVPCGCGGEAILNHGHMITATGQYLANVKCSECGIASRVVWSTDSPEEAVKEAIEAWNRAMSGNVQECAKDARCSERTAKPEWWDGYSEKGWYKCSCGKGVYQGQNYCSGCGAGLEWK